MERYRFLVRHGLGLWFRDRFQLPSCHLSDFKREFAATLEQMGESQFLYFISSSVFSVIGGTIIGRLGLKRSAMAALTTTGLALRLIGGARRFSFVEVSAVLFGLGVAALVVISSSIISSYFGERRQSVFFLTGLSDAGGSMVGPAVLGWWFVHVGRLKLTWRSGYFISAGGAGILGGRFLFSWTTVRWRAPELLVLSICAAGETGAFLATIRSPRYLLGILLYTLSGVFVSAIRPSLNSYLGGRFVGRTAIALSLFAGLSNVGAAVGPYVIGAVGTRMGVEKGIFFGPIFSATLSVLGLVWFLRER